MVKALLLFDGFAEQISQRSTEGQADACFCETAGPHVMYHSVHIGVAESVDHLRDETKPVTFEVYYLSSIVVLRRSRNAVW